MQISDDEYREIRRRHAEQKSRYEQGKTSKVETTKPRVTSRILLNKWQQQKEKDYQYWLKEQAYQHQLKEERYESKQPNYIGIILSSYIAGMKVCNCLLDMTI